MGTAGGGDSGTNEGVFRDEKVTSKLSDRIFIANFFRGRTRWHITRNDTKTGDPFDGSFIMQRISAIRSKIVPATLRDNKNLPPAFVAAPECSNGPHSPRMFAYTRSRLLVAIYLQRRTVVQSRSQLQSPIAKSIPYFHNDTSPAPPRHPMPPVAASELLIFPQKPGGQRRLKYLPRRGKKTRTHIFRDARSFHVLPH